MGKLQDIITAAAERQEQGILEDSAKRQAQPENPGVYNNDGNKAVLVSPVGDLTSPEEMMVRAGFSPDEWVITRPVVNWWEVKARVGDRWLEGTNHQTKLYLENKKSLLNVVQLVCEGHDYKVPPGSPLKDKSALVAILSDQQVSGLGGPGNGHDEQLHQLVLRWLEYNKPSIVVCTGDLINGTPASRYSQTIEELASGNMELKKGHMLLGDYRAAVGPKTFIYFIEGNHENRYRLSLLKSNASLANLHPAGDTSQPELTSIRNLLQTDRLGIICAEDTYPHGQIMLGPYLAARHGWLVRKGSGYTAHATLDHLGYSICVGHTHRGGIVYQTKFELSGKSKIISAMEAFTLCKVDRFGQGYSPNPDWQPGFLGIHLHADGTFAPSPAIYVNGVLIYENQKYWYDERGKIKFSV